MTPLEIISSPELTEMRKVIQTTYREWMDECHRANALERAIERGHIQASAYAPNNTPGRRLNRADAECETARTTYAQALAAYAKRTDELYAENGHISRHWVDFESPEALASKAVSEQFVRIRGAYLNALNNGTREVRINAITECEMRLLTEMGSEAAAQFIRGLDQSNRRLYDAIRGTK